MEFIKFEKVKDGKYLKNYELTYRNKKGNEKKYEIVSRRELQGIEDVVGKPSGDIMDYLARRAGTTREQTAMVGDRLYTDVAAGVNNGYTGILVLSGEADQKDAEESDVVPDLIFTSVKEMIPFI